MKYVSTVSYQVVLNGYVGGKFQPTRGLRQGDPLSPFLFLICGEGLSSLMRLAAREGLSKGVKCVNFDKSTVFFSKNTLEEEMNLVVNLLGVCSSNEPERYLGLQNIVGRKKKDAFLKLKDRIKKELTTRVPDFFHKVGKRVLKAKYYPRSSFLEAQLGSLPSLSWKSIWAAKGLLKKELCWRIGQGHKVSIWEDCWIQGIDSLQRSNNSENVQLVLVSDLIDHANRKWREEIVSNTFQPEVARSIFQIPLSASAHEDFQVWKGELTGTFSVRSVYKLLQVVNLDPNHYLLQTESKLFFRKLWKLQLPPRVAIII
ncbi:hypothetical protein J1N35_028482 [Gossypium stocksii]|uniref:Reverse transcriptase domain-containing protein n=1 Tax=Gossypium stocksii TaxID=47602 RepID=A0A9D3UW49_9ROSI|nr:hypothetical protein J1N35_028482 [Gossypium stocksii]